MIKNYLEPFYNDGELERQNKYFEIIIETDKKIKELTNRKLDVLSRLKEITWSDLEIGETQDDRNARQRDLGNKIIDLDDQLKDLNHENHTAIFGFNAVDFSVKRRYFEQKKDSEILNDCLDLIENLELSDVFIKGAELETLTPPSGNETNDGTQAARSLKIDSDVIHLTHTIRFGYIVKNRIIDWYLGHFEDSKTIFEIYKAIYDRTLVFYPDGFSDQEKKNRFCIFDDQFFNTLDVWNQKQADKKERIDYELAVANYRPDIDRHWLPSSPKISAVMYALGDIGTEPHQMTIDEYLQTKEVNDLVTFRGLDDVGLQFVFNENDVKKDTVLVTFKNLENARGGGTAPSVVFAMVLEKMRELGYFYGGKLNTAVTISVKELIESGAYANRSSSKRALENALSTFQELMINLKNKKTGLNTDALWFSSIGWKDKGTLLLKPNSDINWRLVGKHFAIYPIYLYKLSRHAFKLAFYIFTQARINKNPNEDGDISFKISLTLIGHELGLPSLESIKNFKYKQNYLDKITKAMKEIEDTDQEFYKENRLVYLNLEHAKNLSHKEIIESGLLVVTIKKGKDVTEHYQDIHNRKDEHIEKQRRVKEKAKRTAKEQSSQT